MECVCAVYRVAVLGVDAKLSVWTQVVALISEENPQCTEIKTAVLRPAASVVASLLLTLPSMGMAVVRHPDMYVLVRGLHDWHTSGIRVCNT